MRFVPRRAALGAAIAAAFAASPPSHAVRLDADGLGQALIFPYYSAQTAQGSALNTYLSIVNHTPDAKAVRVRLRDGRMGAAVLEFNLFLSPNDVWTGAVIPAGDGAQLLTADVSCTDPPIPSQGIVFGNSGYTGALDDGAGTGLDRTREGYVEAIEMATLTGTSVAAVTHTSAGPPANCAAVQGFVSVAAAPPTGGLSGTFTLINVANGMEFSTNAEALAQLSTRHFFRAAADSYPDWNAVEIDPVSVVVANGGVYRSVWSRPVDAVSAVLMRSTWEGEFVLDAATASLTDLVVTFPTRRFYVGAQKAEAPFTARADWSADCGWSLYVAGRGTSGTGAGEPIFYVDYDREARPTPPVVNDMGAQQAPNVVLCAANAAFPIIADATQLPSLPAASLLASRTGGILMGMMWLRDSHSNGSFRMGILGTAALTSSAASIRMDTATGAVTSGAHTYRGLPVVGFTVRSYTNGTLTCTAGKCQGNYGGAFPLKFEPSISP